MKTFFNSISLIKQGKNSYKGINNNTNTNSIITMDNEVDKIL